MVIIAQAINYSTQ